MLRVVRHPEVSAELEAAGLWYEERQPGLDDWPPGAPIERAAVKVHHSYDMQHLWLHTVYDRVGKPMKVELTVIASNPAPPFRVLQNAGERHPVILKKIIVNLSRIHRR